ncbi:MAG: response regulator transcription factor [Treponemataceae bacterium]|nr:response regulator transcription factor [Treponemataceae bacterium]
MSDTGKTKVLLGEDQALFAESLKTFLNNYAEDMTVLGIAPNGKVAVEMTKELSPDVILMDVRMPVMDGIQAVRAIKEFRPDIKIIMLSTYHEDEFVRDALMAGASGYLLKDISPTELIISIRALNSGILQISPEIIKNLVQQKYVEPVPEKKATPELEWLDTLTKREREIFALLVTGADNDQIAEELHLAEQTVRNQISTIYSKLGVKNRFEIIQLANKVR